MNHNAQYLNNENTRLHEALILSQLRQDLAKSEEQRVRLREDLERVKGLLARSEERRVDMLVLAQKSHEAASQALGVRLTVGTWRRSIDQCIDSVTSQAQYPGHYRSKMVAARHLVLRLESMLEEVPKKK